MSSAAYVLVGLLIVVFLICFSSKGGFCSAPQAKEGFSSGGYLTTSGLNFNNRLSYTLPPNESGFSGGTFLPGYVLF